MEQYTVMYEGIELYGYAMTEYEKAVAEELRRELMALFDSLEVPREKCVDGSPYLGRLQDNADFFIKYAQAAGFYVLYGERGMFTLMDGFPEKDREKAKFLLLESAFFTGGIMHELNARDTLQQEWARKYSAEYDSRKASFEYVIRMLKTVFGRFPDDVISAYTRYMNKWFDETHWYFDTETMSFEECPPGSPQR